MLSIESALGVLNAYDMALGGNARGLELVRRRAGRRPQHRSRLRLVDRRPGDDARALPHAALRARGAVRLAARRRLRQRARSGRLRAGHRAVAPARLRGRKLIHPSQIEPCNRLYAPSQQELDYYARVLEAFDKAVAQGSASTTVDGKMIDEAMAKAARRVLDQAAAWKKAG